VTEVPDAMRAIRVNFHGGSEVLKLENIPVPEPKAGEALVRVAVAGVNFIDVYKRKGVYKIPLPSTLGEEGAGTIAAIGPGPRSMQIGDRVAWSSMLGAYAEHAIVPLSRLVPLPDNVEMQVGAAAMLQGMTAHYLATSTYQLRSSDTCLIHAAAGGVGLLLVQIAKRVGARVIATVGNDVKAALARNAGADEVIVYTRDDFVEETKRITNGKGVQVVYDSVGQTTFLKGLDVLAPRGMMVLFGASSGPVAPIDPQLLNQKGSLFLTRPTLHHYTIEREELLSRADDVFSWIAGGQLDIRIGATYPLADLARAHDALEGRQTTGKVLITI
jgi:NADPH2:quinone reductase